ncbi:MAG: rRNA maturation RNase YbeY [Acidobacteriota bacterium]
MARSAARPPAPGLAVHLDNSGRFREVRPRTLRPWLARVVAELVPDARSFAVRFCGDRTIRRLNREFRGKDEATDVLSFPGGYTPEGLHLGDVVVSLPTARRQAAALGHGIERELRELLLHGVLHCMGYDHEADDGAMDRLETRLRRRLLGRPRRSARRR